VPVARTDDGHARAESVLLHINHFVGHGDVWRETLPPNAPEQISARLRRKPKLSKFIGCRKFSARRGNGGMTRGRYCERDSQRKYSAPHLLPTQLQAMGQKAQQIAENRRLKIRGRLVEISWCPVLLVWGSSEV